jgi:hypothetical protein
MRERGGAKSFDYGDYWEDGESLRIPRYELLNVPAKIETPEGRPE